jgi:hypothetical protein
MCSIPNGFRDKAISLYTAPTRNTPCPHTSCEVHWSWRQNFWKCIIRVLRKLYKHCHLDNTYQYRSRVVGIATGYGLNDWGIGVRVSLGSRILTSSYRPDRLWFYLEVSPLYNGYRGFFPGGKMAGEWSWSLTSNYTGVKKMWIYTSIAPYFFMAWCLIS